MNKKRIRMLTEQALSGGGANGNIIRDELYKKMDEYYSILEYLKFGYENQILPRYDRRCTATLYDDILDKLESLIDASRYFDTISEEDLDTFDKFIAERRDYNHPERFYIKMYKNDSSHITTMFSIVRLR